jgi:hypothetical protein
MNIKKKIPDEIKHDWQCMNKKTGKYRCKVCKVWTSNLPLYKDEMCSKKDRRKNKVDRRES